MQKFDWKAIQASYETGLTYKDLIDKFGVCSASIQKARDRGDFIPRDKGQRQPLKYDWNLIQKLYDEGASQHDLHKQFGISFCSFAKARKAGRFVSRSLRDAARLKAEQGWTPTPMGTDARKELSERQSLHNSGGRCKWYEVNGQNLQGTWERDAGLKLAEMGIEWRKCGGKADIIRYVLDDKERSYTPDFYLPEQGLWLEFKGYWWGDDREKMDAVKSQHPEKDICVIEKDAYFALINEGSLPWAT